MRNGGYKKPSAFRTKAMKPPKLKVGTNYDDMPATKSSQRGNVGTRKRYHETGKVSG